MTTYFVSPEEFRKIYKYITGICMYREINGGYEIKQIWPNKQISEYLKKNYEKVI